MFNTDIKIIHVSIYNPTLQPKGQTNKEEDYMDAKKLFFYRDIDIN